MFDTVYWIKGFHFLFCFLFSIFVSLWFSGILRCKYIKKMFRNIKIAIYLINKKLLLAKYFETSLSAHLQFKLLFPTLVVVNTFLLFLTQWQLFPRVWWESEVKNSHGGDKEARHYQVEKIIKSSSPNLYYKGDIKIWLRTAFIDYFILLGRNSCN